MKTKEEYLQSQGRCPHCDSEDIEGSGRRESDGDWTDNYMHCNVCGASWTDNYTLTGFTMQYIPPLKLQTRWVYAEDGDVRPATRKEVQESRAFIGLYKQDPATKQWEWMSDYKDGRELYDCTGISTVELIGD